MSGLPEEKNKKIAAYAGLAIRAGKAVFGADNVYVTYPKIVLADITLADNTRKKLETRCKTLNIPLITVERLGETLSRPNCKVLGIGEPNLAKAIKNVTDTVFEGE